MEVRVKRSIPIATPVCQGCDGAHLEPVSQEWRERYEGFLGTNPGQPSSRVRVVYGFRPVPGGGEEAGGGAGP